MAVTASKAIYFECEICGRGQFISYTLEPSWEDDRDVNADRIVCEYCGNLNRVIEEL